MVTYDLENGTETPSEWFVKELEKIYHEVDEKFANPKVMQPLTQQEEDSHAAAEICHICEDLNRPFNQSKKLDRKISDHCHLTGKLKFEKMYMFIHRIFITISLF